MRSEYIYIIERETGNYFLTRNFFCFPVSRSTNAFDEAGTNHPGKPFYPAFLSDDFYDFLTKEK